ncbi:hypothetical protein AAII07_16700 [Microvirga sp. 0TCS3.31]
MAADRTPEASLRVMCRHHSPAHSGVAADRQFPAEHAAMCRHPGHRSGPAAVHRAEVEVVVHRIRRGPVATARAAMTLEAWMT